MSNLLTISPIPLPTNTSFLENININNINNNNYNNNHKTLNSPNLRTPTKSNQTNKFISCPQTAPSKLFHYNNKQHNNQQQHNQLNQINHLFSTTNSLINLSSSPLIMKSNIPTTPTKKNNNINGNNNSLFINTSAQKRKRLQSPLRSHGGCIFYSPPNNTHYSSPNNNYLPFKGKCLNFDNLDTTSIPTNQHNHVTVTTNNNNNNVTPTKSNNKHHYNNINNNTPSCTISSPTFLSNSKGDRFIPNRPKDIEIVKHLLINSPASNSSFISNKFGNVSNHSAIGDTSQLDLMPVPFHFESCLQDRLFDGMLDGKKLLDCSIVNNNNNNENVKLSHASNSCCLSPMKNSFLSSGSGNSSNCDKDNNNNDSFNNSLNNSLSNVSNVSSTSISSNNNYKKKNNNIQQIGSPSFQTKLQQVYSCNKIVNQLTEEEKRQFHYNRYFNNYRNISNIPERILDAPNLVDDFYLNLLDWSQNNLLAVALSETIYLWDATSGSINKLCSLDEDDDNNAQQQHTNNIVTSVCWIDEGRTLAIGTNDHMIEIWNVEKKMCIKRLRGHAARVGSLSWNTRHNYLLTSGSRDGKVLNHDLRLNNNQIVSIWSAHTQEVCGLKWSFDGMQLASGGNDNHLNIWDLNMSGTMVGPKFTMKEHTAAVKALAWCPWQYNLLATGGGTADRKIHFWNTSSGALLRSVDTKSQVCSLIWSKYDQELVSSHGFSQHQLIVWKYPT
ncbi:hypothetical protein ABK040_008287, partial [Willaertia magna]